MPDHFRYSTRQKSSKKSLTLIAGLITVILIAGAYLYYQQSRYDYYIKTPVDPSDDKNISFTIKQGDIAPLIAKNLGDKDLILDEDSFKTYVKNNNLDRKIVAGRFLLNKSLTIPEIVEKITDTRQAEFILTVPEGSTSIDIDKKLADLGVTKAGDFINSVKAFKDYDKYQFLNKTTMQTLDIPLEGYLFPDTYFINPNNFHSEDLIQLMLNNFKKKLGDNLTATHDHSLTETIIMASIVEKEVRTNNDLPIVAGILWKRLESHWQLGTDATLLYLKTDRSIDYQDLKEDSPYNTRKHVGLPPGPICNPGIKAIMATINPKDSEYFYYLTKPDTGEVVYAKTNEEHNANRAKYLN